MLGGGGGGHTGSIEVESTWGTQMENVGTRGWGGMGWGEVHRGCSYGVQDYTSKAAMKQTPQVRAVGLAAPSALVATHIISVTGRYICTTAHTVYTPVNSILGPEEAHLVGAVAHDGRGGPCPKPQQPLLLCNCHSTVDRPLHSHTFAMTALILLPMLSCWSW